MSTWESAAILDVAEKGNTKNPSHGIAVVRNVSFPMEKPMKLAVTEETASREKLKAINKKHKNKGPKSFAHKEMCPGCSWCCTGEKEPIYPGFEKKPNGENGDKVDKSKTYGMVDIGAWEEKHVPGAKEYYKEIDVNIKNRIWVDKPQHHKSEA